MMPPKNNSRLDLYRFAQLKPDAVAAACAGRDGGVSSPPYDQLNLSFHVGDDPDAVRTNRERLAAALGTSLDRFIVPSQSHGKRVQLVGQTERARGAYGPDDAIPDTDALITADVDVVLAVTVADCVPIVLYDPRTPAIGLIHAGWRGTVEHAAAATVAAMQEVFGTNPRNLLACLGPSIGPTSYIIGQDVASLVRSAYPDAHLLGPARQDGKSKALFDLWQANRIDLEEAGVDATKIELAGIDTYQQHARFFSDRHQRPTGRSMTVVFLGSSAASPGLDRGEPG